MLCCPAEAIAGCPTLQTGVLSRSILILGQMGPLKSRNLEPDWEINLLPQDAFGSENAEISS